MKIIFDAMGGDNAPGEIVKGALDASQEFGVDIVLCGRGEEMMRLLESYGIKDLPSGIELVDASEVIGMEDNPANAVRDKKNSSLAVGLTLLRDGGGDALVSAGNTGAILSGATLIVKRVHGIRRAALAPFIPNATGGFILIDSGANVECTPEYLLQFAFMGSYYAQDVLKIDSPRVGLLNNGIEPTKGRPLHIEAHEMLVKSSRDGYLNFVGNVEAKDVMSGACDVLVCDGFSGNILLKSLEGMATFILSELQSIYKSSFLTQFSALFVKKSLKGLKKRMNPDTVGGTILLGVTKPVIKAHGSSNAAAIVGAVRQAISAVEANAALRLSGNISRMKIDEL